MEWGVKNEALAKADYSRLAETKHQLFELDEAGLFIHPNYPHLGASPDGLVRCACCGDGIIEVKCPYSIRDRTPKQAANKAKFYLEPTENGLQLSRSHQYYYQIQGQLAISQRWYCDFICWTPQGFHVERIERAEHVFDEMLPKLTNFFVQVILPEILQPGSINKQPNSQTEPETPLIQLVAEASTDSDEEIEQDAYCYCRKGEYGSMIACDNEQCPHQW